MMCLESGLHGSPEDSIAAFSSEPPSEKYRFAWWCEVSILREEKETYDDFPG
jgi:hypothetical protein